MTRVLVVEDDPTIRRVIAYILSDEGYQVDEASDGREALEVVSSQHPDIIILDMKMPGMDGWEFARRYRERYNHRAAILVITAANDAAARAADIQARGYVAKPFDLHVLIEQVSQIAGAGSPDPQEPRVRE